MTPTLNIMSAALNNVNTLFNTISSNLAGDLDTRSLENIQTDFDNIRSEIEQAHEAQEQLNSAVQRMNASGAVRQAEQLNNTVNNTEMNIRDNIEQQENFNREIENGTRSANGLKMMIAGVVGVFSVRAGVQWLRQSLDITNQNIRAEQRLANVMANRGATYEEFLNMQRYAAAIQERTSIGTTAMLGAAGEFARSIGDTQAIEVMMDSLADFAAGVGDVFAATPETMAGYAQYFVAAMEGNYRMLERRAGIFLSDMQRDVLQYGDDMQRALMVQEIVNQSWGGLAEQMAQIPKGMRASMTNTFNDIRSAIGAQLLPVIMILLTTIQSHLPQIESLLQGIITPVQFLIRLITTMINVSFAVADVFSNNWSWIEPIIWGIVAAFGAWKAIMIILGIKTMLLTAKQWLLNVALTANPIGVVIMLIAAIITAIGVWIHRVGGLRIAWLTVTTHIQNLVGDMKASVLSGLQSMVNGAINIINGFIGVLNSLPGVDIGAIDHVTFGTKAQLENEAARQARLAELDLARQLNAESVNEYAVTTSNFLSHHFTGDGFGSMGGMGRDVSDIASNTGKIASISGENLKYWRDIAERDNINRFTTARINVKIPSITNQINSEMDLDKVVEYIVDGVEESLETTAERVNDYV